ncbi:esterase [Enterococcus faecium]|nr:esterase [Enterococcus faecium]SMJ11268.1 esterase [Enterococcus faecium]SMK46013.1 esterase [Enterococcus faecium]SMK48913.1 esterase [Enterococcus faecium]SMK54847.1 esterase [Enterococcus faecium]
MKWFKRIVIAVPVIIVVILVTVFLINQITPKPISLLVRKQFDTSEKEQVYARPDDFQQKIEQIDIKKEISYPSKYKNNNGSIISRTDRKSFYRSLLSMKKQNIQKLR